MFSDELFSDDAAAPEVGRSRSHYRRSGGKLGFKGVGRLGLALILVIGTFVGLTVDAVLTAAPAFAAQANSCTTPASGGTAVTWHAGVASTESIVCQEETGISGTSAYPTISVNTDTLPADGNPTLATGASCTTSTSGSGTTEEYIETCKFTDTPTAADESGTAYTASFTSTPAAFTGSTLTPTNSGTLSVTINAPTVTIIDPASGGTAATWHEGVTSSYTVEAEEQSGISGTTAYPSSISIATDTLPADSSPTLASSCTTGTSGSGTTEEYIDECAFSGTPSAADAGSYAATFGATGDGGVGTAATSGALNITVNAATLTCIDPASGGSSATFNSSAGGTVNAYTVECEEASGISGVTAYPTSISIDPSSNLPADATFSAAYNGTGTLPSTCTHGTSGSGTTEEYILECDLNETATSADNGSYTGVFDAVGAGSTPSTTSGTLTLTVTGPNDVCTAPATGGTATTFREGIANTYTVSCYGIGFSSANAGNYPASITVNTGALPADATEATSTSSSPACTTTTSGTGLSEEYILNCAITETPTSTDAGSYPVTFTATPGVNGGNTVTSGTWTLTVAPVTISCIDPASGGTATNFYENSANSYTVECEAQSGISGTTAYPSSINIATGALPADGNPTFATSTSSSPACTTGTSGSGTTEEYILECALADTPTNADSGSYPLTFTAAGPSGDGSLTSGTLTVNITPPTTTCTAPAAGGTSTSWVDGTAESYPVACYSTGFGSANAGNYPTSITLNSGALPSDAKEATSTSSSPACTQSTSGSGVTEEYILTCPVTDTPVYADNGTYHATFLAMGGANGAPNATSGAWTLTISQPAPSWETDGTTDGNYYSAIKGVPFCFDLAVTTSTSGGATTGSPGSLPLTSLTAGTTPSGVANYQIKNVNLAAGTGQICGTNNNNTASAPVIMAPVATNSGGSATDSIPLWSQPECTWTDSGTDSSNVAISMFDTNQDLEQAGSQSAFGAPITNGETLGTSKNYPTCTGDVGMSNSGGLGGAWTANTANPLPTPTDTNPSAAQGDLASSNLDLTSANSGAAGGCWGATIILSSTSTTAFGSGSTADMTLPSSWVNGGDCAYGSLGSNSAGGNTDVPGNANENSGGTPTGDAACPPSQADVNAGYTNCGIIISSGNDENGSTNYSSMALFLNGQPVPQTPTASLSSGNVAAGDTVSVTGGTNWWGDPDGAPDKNPTGDNQNNAYDFYSVSAPSVYIGTSRGTAVPVVDSTVTIPANTYVCTGAESTTVGPNPCTLTAGQPTGSFQVPPGLAPGAYNIYIDESNTSPLPGNGPNDAYQTATGRNLGTVESATLLNVDGLMTVKTSSTNYADNGFSKAGDTIDYNYAVTNTGPDTLTGITVNDNLVPSADINCPDSSLAAGASENCTGSYTTSQQDVDNGSVTNTATSSGINPNSETITSAPSSVTVNASDATSSLSLVKTASTTYADNGYGAAGDVISYSYDVTNTGTDTLSSIAVSDSLIPSADITCPDATLAPGASENCTATYTVLQSDVDFGSVTNTATASGTSEDPKATTSGATSNSSTVDVTASDATSSLTLTKSTSSGGYSAAGDMISYSYDVTNTGTDTLSGIAVSDSLIPSADITCPDATLAPGASENCTATYTVTAADVSNGSVTNTATASGTSEDPNATTSGATSNSSSVTVDRTLLELTKSTTSTGYGAAGDTIPYSYLVTNGTSGTLSNITVNDSLIPSADITCPDSSLAASDSETCTATYTVTQADVDNGNVTNTASVSGVDSQSITVTSGYSSVTVLASYATSSLSLVKTASTTYADNGYGAAGDTISYSYVVTNTGTTTLTGIGVNDSLIPSADITCPNATLAPGASETCTGSYTVTQTDVNNGSVSNSATASGTTLDPTTVTSNTSSATVDASDATSSLSLTKASGQTSFSAAGQVLTYTYKVKNTGTETLSDVAVGDSLISYVNCPDSTLAPGASETCTASYTTTQEDVDNGSVANSATATAKAPVGDGGATVTSNTSSVTVDYSGILITTTSPLPTATIGTPYSDTLTVSGGNGGKPKWSAESGLPKGLKLQAGTGVLSGTVNHKVVPGTYTLTIQVKETHKGSTVEDVKFLSLPIKY